MKKLFLTILLTSLIIGCFLILRFWNNWNQLDQLKLVSTSLNKEAYKIGEVIKVKSIIESPLFYELELNKDFPLPKGLEHTENGLSKYRNIEKGSKWIFTESFFATDVQSIHDLKRTLHFHGSDKISNQKLELTYPEIKITSRDLKAEMSPLLIGDISLPTPKKGLSVQFSLMIILLSSLTITLLFWLFLPKKAKVYTAAHMCLDEISNKQSFTSQKDELFFLSDLTRDFLSQEIDPAYAGANRVKLKELTQSLGFMKNEISNLFEVTYQVRYEFLESFELKLEDFRKAFQVELKRMIKEQQK